MLNRKLTMDDYVAVNMDFNLWTKSLTAWMFVWISLYTVFNNRYSLVAFSRVNTCIDYWTPIKYKYIIYMFQIQATLRFCNIVRGRYPIDIIHTDFINALYGVRPFYVQIFRRANQFTFEIISYLYSKNTGFITSFIID